MKHFRKFSENLISFGNYQSCASVCRNFWIYEWTLKVSALRVPGGNPVDGRRLDIITRRAESSSAQTIAKRARVGPRTQVVSTMKMLFSMLIVFFVFVYGLLYVLLLFFFVLYTCFVLCLCVFIFVCICFYGFVVCVVYI